jgi:hypothetical protein
MFIRAIEPKDPRDGLYGYVCTECVDHGEPMGSSIFYSLSPTSRCPKGHDRPKLISRKTPQR